MNSGFAATRLTLRFVCPTTATAVSAYRVTLPSTSQTVSTFALPSDFYKGAIAKRPDSCGDMSLKTACLFRRLRSIGCHEITFPFVSPHGFKGSSRAASGAGCRSMHPS